MLAYIIKKIQSFNSYSKFKCLFIMYSTLELVKAINVFLKSGYKLKSEIVLKTSLHVHMYSKYFV